MQYCDTRKEKAYAVITVGENGCSIEKTNILGCKQFPWHMTEKNHRCINLKFRVWNQYCLSQDNDPV